MEGGDQYVNKNEFWEDHATSLPQLLDGLYFVETKGFKAVSSYILLHMSFSMRRLQCKYISITTWRNLNLSHSWWRSR